jgi:hypothetical protein
MSGKLTVIAIFAALALVVGIALIGSAFTGEPDSIFAKRTCPAGWQPYFDPQDRYSICHPGEMVISKIDSSGVTSVSISGIGYGVILHWQDKIGADGPEAACVLTYRQSVEPQSTEIRPLTVNGRDILACFTTTYVDLAKTAIKNAAVSFYYPVAEGGYVRSVGSFFTGLELDSSRAVVLAILDTLRTR